MTDLVKLFLRAGRGGHGKVSFWRERGKPKGGPDGGNGGDGGHIIIRGDNTKATLKSFAGVTEFKAQDGGAGGKLRKSGAKGQDMILNVPLGTSISSFVENDVARNRRMTYGFEVLHQRKELRHSIYVVEKESEVFEPKEEARVVLPLSGEPVDGTPSEWIKPPVSELPEVVPITTITEHGQEIIICQGGFGGRGNEAFKSSLMTTPLKAEYGTAGEERAVILELKLLADVGLVGLPNAGKSTLLSVLTEAKPKIAAYPFTTLEPHLGLLKTPRKELVIADIPGLIEGASQGKGLGFDFLRHIENCQVLLFVLFLEEADIFNEELSSAQKATLLWKQWETLRHELATYSKEILTKPMVVGINKMDLYEDDLQTAITQKFKKAKIKPVFFSAAKQANIAELLKQLTNIFD